MPPGTRRAHRGGYVEHDDFEGLPVRQWRQDWVSVAPPEPKEQQQQNDMWALELPHGMPKDSNLLPPHTQELLRAARSGVLYRRAPPEDEEADPEMIMPEKPEKKEEDSASRGFSVKVWRQIPRSVEGAGSSYLASRRKNTITIASKTIADKISLPTVTRATVRRIDAAGNPYTEDVTLVEGLKVDGEIVSTRVEAIPAPLAEAHPALGAPIRRRPPPPKRKSKAGPGRGRKKAKMLLSRAEQSVHAITNGQVLAVKQEGENGMAPKVEGNETPNQDSEMADGDENDEDDEDDDDDEGEEGEEGEDADETAVTADESQIPQEDIPESMNLVPPPERSGSIDLEMKDEPTPEASTPPNIITPAPALVSYSSGSPMADESPLETVTIPSAAEPGGDSTLLIASAQPVSDITTGSTAAGPPSAIVGETPDEAVNRDLPPTALAVDETLLPPSPQYVGNISSPVASPNTNNLLDKSPNSGGAQAEIAVGEEVVPQEASQDVIIDEYNTAPDTAPDTVTPVAMPAPELEASSQVTAPPNRAASVEIGSEPAIQPTTPPPADPVLSEAAATIEQVEPEPAESTKPSSEEEPAEAQAGESDILDGLIGELDRQANASVEQPAILEETKQLEKTDVEVVVDTATTEEEEEEESTEAIEKTPTREPDIEEHQDTHEDQPIEEEALAKADETP